MPLLYIATPTIFSVKERYTANKAREIEHEENSGEWSETASAVSRIRTVIYQNI